MTEESKYRGMTVNERLFVAKLFDKFYNAVREKYVEKAIAILKKVELTDESIDPILESVGLINK
ncbi:hypothetical protein [Pedobacter flavus]|uniref:Uncharacterized protein n=1 Tax=Pedobacter flavus TaxID=3113906 RepID=A0ABU7H1E9_9SPHI|nr:hypothetical protein [Pedobacter sp. VNH31]MEE1885060.1 hypothetical protein [Pedobacter sp. VNH31]